MKTNIRSIALLLTFLYLVPLESTVQALSPAPDGCYPNYTTAEGCNALATLGGGLANTGVGWYSLFSDASGNYNTGVGAGTLLFNTADENTATGAAALLSNTVGTENTATGAGALLSNTTGFANVAIGAGALFSNTTATQNTAVGFNALKLNTTGGSNIAVGTAALSLNTTGTNNTAIGYVALNNSVGSHNTAVGNSALVGDTTGTGNTAVGDGAGVSVTTANNVICIGIAGNNVDNSCYIGNIFGSTSSNGVGVFVNSNGRLGTSTSSRRFKENIQPMDHASETLYSLEPVSFRYKKAVDPENAEGTTQFGLVAEDVEKVNPALVVRDKEGKAYSVRYDQVNAMLLNEFLKEHRKIQQQRKDFQAALAQQQKQIEALTAGLQKVSAQLQLGKPARQTVLNNQ